MAKYEWDKLKAKYLAGDYKNLRAFAEQENINYNVLRRKASKWQDEKSQVTHKKVTKIVTKTVEKIAEKESDRNARIASLADKLADKLEQAIEQIDQYIVTNKTKTKTVEYDNSIAKPTKEVIVEDEVKQISSGIVDKPGLKFLTAALKDIHDIQITAAEKLAIERQKLAIMESKAGGTGEDIPDDGFLEALEAKAADIWGGDKPCP